MMLPEEDRQALKKDGYKMTANGVMPIAHPLQTYNRKSYSSETQLYRQGERESSSTSSTRTIQPKPNPSTNKPQGWQSYRQGERESSSTPTHSTQPKLNSSTPGWQSYRQGERESSSTSPTHSTQPKPNPSTNKPQGWQSYRQGERESSSTPTRSTQPKLNSSTPGWQSYRQGERESSSTSSTRTIQPKPNPSTNKPQGWQSYRQGEREPSSTPTHSTQPKLNSSTPGWQSYRQGERESSSTSSTRTIQPKPNPSTNKPQGWQSYRQGERESSSPPTHSTQPKLNSSTPGWQSYRQGERESSSTPTRTIQPKPNSSTPGWQSYRQGERESSSTSPTRSTQPTNDKIMAPKQTPQSKLFNGAVNKVMDLFGYDTRQRPPSEDNPFYRDNAQYMPGYEIDGIPSGAWAQNAATNYVGHGTKPGSSWDNIRTGLVNTERSMINNKLADGKSGKLSFGDVYTAHVNVYDNSHGGGNSFIDPGSFGVAVYGVPLLEKVGINSGPVTGAAIDFFNNPEDSAAEGWAKRMGLAVVEGPLGIPGRIWNTATALGWRP